MDVARLVRVLLYCVCINYAVLILWFVAFLAGRGWLYHLHTTWFRLSPEGFDTLHYGGMAVYKIGILLLNVAPLIAIYLSA